jgi:hypothetical protein
LDWKNSEVYQVDITQTSTHIARKDRRMGDDWLENLLEDYGTFVNTPIPELYTPMKTSIKVAEEMKTEIADDKVPIYGFWQGGEFHIFPLWVRRLIYELTKMWKRNERSTVSRKATVPRYNYHWGMRRIGKALGLLNDDHPDLYNIIKYRYINGWSAKATQKECGLPVSTYYHRLGLAKKNIYKILKTLE